MEREKQIKRQINVKRESPPHIVATAAFRTPRACSFAVCPARRVPWAVEAGRAMSRYERADGEVHVLARCCSRVCGFLWRLARRGPDSSREPLLSPARSCPGPEAQLSASDLARILGNVVSTPEGEERCGVSRGRRRSSSPERRGANTPSPYDAHVAHTRRCLNHGSSYGAIRPKRMEIYPKGYKNMELTK